MMNALRLPLRLSLVFSLFLAIVGIQAAAPIEAKAAVIDLSLGILYSNPADDQSAGAWFVSAKSDEQGIAGISFSLQGISGIPVWELPTGEFSNGDQAGFTTQLTEASTDGFRQFLASQSSFTTAGGLAGAFYQFGVQDNGSPNYPGAPSGANEVGPNLPTLSTTTNVPWAAGADPLGNSAWNSAGLIAAGQFSASQTPSFFESGMTMPSGSVFTSVGTAGVLGDRSLASATAINMIVRTNLANLTGDYNGDGSVDAADYTVWRSNLGASVAAGTGADGSGNGIIDEADYTAWRSNFGATGAGAAASATAVPEPSGLFLLLGLLSTLAGIRSRS